MVRWQHLLPQHLLSTLIGKLADSRCTCLKNTLIRRFIKIYKINMEDAIYEKAEDYLSFNQFFIRRLKPHLRIVHPQADTIISPVDGVVAQIGEARIDQLLQAKNFYFDLATLLGGDKLLAQSFYNGPFATLYLAPHNYHRIHMPMDGRLSKMIYVPGKLFSVNKMTSHLIPNLYSRNERLICIFDTQVGPMAIILVGALIVGRIQTVWMQAPIRSKQIYIEASPPPVHLSKGAELGHFQLGSTVILLFVKDKIKWETNLQSDSILQFGQPVGKITALSLP